jgi:hypothetical protein
LQTIYKLQIWNTKITKINDFAAIQKELKVRPPFIVEQKDAISQYKVLEHKVFDNAEDLIKYQASNSEKNDDGTEKTTDFTEKVTRVA